MLEVVELAAPRWTVRAPVAASGLRGRHEWQAVNISVGGMFIAGEPLLPPGSLIDFDVLLPAANGPPVELTGKLEVVWTRLEDAADELRPAGMGVRFVDLPDDRRVELETYLHELALSRDPDDALARPAVSDEELAAALDTTIPPPVGRIPELPPLPSSFRGAASPDAKAAPARLGPGARLGRYIILRSLGSGGMGDVYLAHHVVLRRRVAIKVLRQELAADREALRRFFDEARLVNHISNEHIVQITDIASAGPRVFFVMELVEGPTLADVLGGGPLDPSRCADLGLQLADALEAIHGAGIVHRDLKPGNIMLAQRGGREVLKLLDFGLARLREGCARAGRSGSQVLGTPGFLAPEVLMGASFDHRADIYAFGVVLFTMLTGRLPIEPDQWLETLGLLDKPAPRPSQLAKSRIPKQLDRLVSRCIDVHPAQRPESATELVDVLRPLVESGA